MMMVNGDI